MRSYSRLSEDERDQIGVLRAAGRSIGAIARALCRAKSTISRELQRNALPSGGYSPLHAAGAYQLSRRREAILEREAALRLFVGDRLAEAVKSGATGRPNARLPLEAFIAASSRARGQPEMERRSPMKKVAPKAEDADAKPYQPTRADAQAFEAYMAAQKKAASRLKVEPGAKGAVTVDYPDKALGQITLMKALGTSAGCTGPLARHPRAIGTP